MLALGCFDLKANALEINLPITLHHTIIGFIIYLMAHLFLFLGHLACNLLKLRLIFGTAVDIAVIHFYF